MKIQKTNVIEKALQLLNQEGMEGLTMRKLASELNVKAASLYWHFPHKQALLEELSEKMIEHVAVGDLSGLTPEEQIWLVSKETRSALLAYRDGASVFAGTYVFAPNTMRIAELMIQACEALNKSREKPLPKARVLDGVFSFLYFLLGLIQEEQSYYTLSQTVEIKKEIQEKISKIDSSRYPSIDRYKDYIFDIDFDQRFQFGINGLIHHLAHENYESV
jgi:TetR/AcrR family tetracycline transcriptional repressor